MKRGLSVRWRLTIVYSLISVVSAAVLLGGIYAVVSHPPKSTYFVGRMPRHRPKGRTAEP